MNDPATESFRPAGEHSTMKLDTLNDIFFAIVERQQARVMMVREGTDWLAISSQQLRHSVRGTARALADWGVLQGDRVAILSENRPEWTIADFACLQLGAVVVPIYATLTADQAKYIMSHSGAKIVFVSTAQQLEKILSIQDHTAVEHIVVMDPIETAHAVPMQRLMERPRAEPDTELAARAHAVRPEDLASIIYTSGTTGIPKGVMLTHGNLASNIRYSLTGFDVGPGQTSLSFLPLSHVTARHADFALLHRGVTLAYCPYIENLPQVLLEVRPHILVAVPRVYEKLYTQVEQHAKGLLKQRIYESALSVGRAHSAEILTGRRPASAAWKLADRLLFSKVRARLGGRVGIFVSGGAPLGKELAEWFAAIGIRIHEGYGLTETSPVVALNSPIAHKLGTVGRPLANVDVRIAGDSEILVRGPSVFGGYWKQPEETSNAFADGWFKTGDIGHLDEDGFLCVTDRKKDLLKTSGGKFIAPQPIENSLTLHSLIASAVVLGDRRKFPSVIISPQFTLLEEWARANHISARSRDELVANAKVIALYEELVGRVNRSLGRHEMLKKILLVPHEFTSADGTLTPSMKIRRKVIEERYARQIAELYENHGRAEGSRVPWKDGAGR
jgi:long-chain acyl-CoA synthetase